MVFEDVARTTTKSRTLSQPAAKSAAPPHRPSSASQSAASPLRSPVKVRERVTGKQSSQPARPAAKQPTAATQPSAPQADTPTYAIRAPLSAFDTWEIEEQLRHVDRILSGARFATELQRPAHADLAHGPHASSAMQAKLVASAAEAARPRRTRLRSRIAWGIVAAGAAALSAGLVLLAAGAIVGRSGWLSCGLPMTLLGQVALLLGMMMQLDLVWKGKRETASKLYRFQKRLLDLEALAAELAPESDEEPAPPADEQQLIAELKTRLDLLSHRLNVPCG